MSFSPAQALAAYVGRQVAAVHVAEQATREGDPEGVHDLRVAMRRLRATLRTYRHLVDTDVTDPIRKDLRTLSLELGKARDLEVVHERLQQVLEHEPDNEVRAAARSHLLAARSKDEKKVRKTTEKVLDSERYRSTLAALDRLAASPPVSPAKEKVVPQALLRDLRRTRRRAHAAETAIEPADRAHELHQTRKATKRLRYAAETAVPVLGRDAEYLVERAKTLQTLLGEHHDTVLTRARLEELADEHKGDESVWARMHAHEEAAALRLEEQFWTAWAAFEPAD